MRWLYIWIALFGLVAGVELFTVLDDDPSSLPLTEVILSYVPREVFWAIWGGFVVWCTVHFAFRKWRR